MIRKIFSKRRYPRFHVKEHTYLVFQSNTKDEIKLQVIDISEGGCAFLYTGSEKDLQHVSYADLTSKNVSYMEQIKISAVSDVKHSGPVRRRGVEFTWMGVLDYRKLKQFIQKVSTCECK